VGDKLRITECKKEFRLTFGKSKSGDKAIIPEMGRLGFSSNNENVRVAPIP
jgi:hypothetical protein